MSRFIKYALSFVAIWAFLFLDYYIFSSGLPAKTFYLQMRRYIPCALAVVVSSALWLQTSSPLGLILPAVTGLHWAILYPLFYFLTLGKSSNFIDNHFDIVIGAYLCAILICLQILLTKLPILGQGLLTLLNILLFIIPIGQIWYWFTYHSVITEAGMMALLQTNKNEAKEFVLQYIGYGGLAAIALGFLVLFIICYKLNSIILQGNAYNAKTMLFALVILVALSSYLAKSFKDTGVATVYLNTKDYFARVEAFNKYHDNNYAELKVTPAAPQFSKPSTIILVIGESASRDFLSVYKDTKNDTTPWLKAMSKSPNGFIFKHAYTSWGQTVPSLERALTEKNQYNDIEFNQSLTIIDMAKKAGYTTYWFSNQGTLSGADTPITLVAKTADHSYWIEDTLAQKSTKQQYDGNLIQYLDKVDPTKNNFIVFHIMGSHDSFINRYPPEFTRFGEAGKQDLLLNYDNSIAYTDYVLEEIYKKAKATLNLQSLVYFSDHGVIPDKKRMPEGKAFTLLRIPLFVYLSPEYTALYPGTAQVLRNNTNQYFTNDLTYELLCGILQIKSSHFLPEESLASPSYKFNRENLTTLLGKVKLTEDTNE